MEALWIIPIYVIFPIIGIITCIIGFMLKKEKRKLIFIPGLLFLATPLLHLLFVFISNNNLKNKLVGKYKYGNVSNALEIYDNGKFELKRTALYTQSGKGTWEIETIDFPILNLYFEESYGIQWLEINEKQDTISLSKIYGDTNFTFGFEKE